MQVCVHDVDYWIHALDAYTCADFCNSDRYWKIVDKLKLTHFYTVPFVLKQLKHSAPDRIEGYSLESLKVIASGGFV